MAVVRDRQRGAGFPQRLFECRKLLGGFRQRPGIFAPGGFEGMLALALFRFLRPQGIQLLFSAVAAVAQELDLLFDAGDFRIDLIERALCRMHCVRRAVMAGAQLFHPLFRIPQPRRFGFQLDAHRLDVAADLDALRLGVALAQQPQQLLGALEAGFEFAVLAGFLGLRFQVLELLAELQADVLDAQQIFARVFQPRLGFPAPFAIFRYAGRLFQKAAQVFRLRLDDARNHALLDDRVAASAQAGAEENVGDVAPAHVHVVQEIRRLAVALEHALDGNFRVGRPGPGRLAQAVVEYQLDAGTPRRLALGRTVEDDVLHVFAAQLLGGGFA